jgi:glycosyltransferase involved in cell wall biosynthesis
VNQKTICFDLRALQIGHENRGIGAYIKSVLENMPKDKNKYIFYCFDKSNPVEDLDIQTNLNYSIVTTRTTATVLESPKNILGILKLIYHKFSPLSSRHPDVFVQFDFNLGLPRWRKTKKIVIGYDLIPLILKDEYMPSVKVALSKALGKKAKLRAIVRSLYYRFRYWISYKVFQRADTVLCISNATAESFQQLLKIDYSKLEVIPLAPVLPDLSKVNRSIVEHIDKPYIFYIGGTDPRKSLKDIVLAFDIVKNEGIDINLVLAGNEFKSVELIPDISGRNAILGSRNKSDIRLVGRVTDAEKLGLYESALAFVFASTYEGFGMPVLEAMAAGCPVIAYNNSSIPEAIGNAGILIPTGSYQSMADEIIKLTKKRYRQQFIHAGRKHAQAFTWKNYVEQFDKILNS